VTLRSLKDEAALLTPIIDHAGRRPAVEGSDWRTMMAPAPLRSGREPDPVFAARFGRTRTRTRGVRLDGQAMIRANEVGDHLYRRYSFTAISRFEVPAWLAEEVRPWTS
jgi:hypothetical protein